MMLLAPRNADPGVNDKNNHEQGNCQCLALKGLRARNRVG